MVDRPDTGTGSTSGAATSGSTTRLYVYDQDHRLIGEYGTSAADVVADQEIPNRDELSDDCVAHHLL